MKYEYCCNCSKPTGKAGAGDDSLYTAHDGPFCEDCFPDKEKPQRTWVGLSLADKEEYLALDFGGNRLDAMDWAEKQLKEKNT